MTARVFFLGLVSAIFCGLVGFSFFKSAGVGIPALFLCFLLLAIPFGKFRKPIFISFIIGTAISAGVFFYFQNIYENAYAQLPEELSGSCAVREKISESMFICDMEDFRLVLLATSGNNIRAGDELDFSGKKKPLAESDRLRLFSEKQNAKYTISEFTLRKSGFPDFRSHFLASASRSIFQLFPPREASLLEWMLLGNGENFDNAQKTAYKTSGLSHLVVASGSNIILVLSFFLLFLKAIPPKIKIPVLLFWVWGYCAIAGMEIPLLRAACMSTTLLLSFKQPLRGICVLLLVATIFSLQNPFLPVYSASFQLSFLATLSLLLLSKPLEGFFGKLRFLKGVSEIISTSISATLFTLPITLFSFGNLAPYGIIANIIVAPLVPVAVFGGLITVILDNIGHSLSTIVGIPAYVALSLINDISTFSQTLPFSYLTLKSDLFAPIFLAIFFSSILFALFFKELRSPQA